MGHSKVSYLTFLTHFYFFFQHTPLEKLDKKHFAKGTRNSDQNGIEQNSLKEEIALLEVKMRRLCELLKEVVTIVICFIIVMNYFSACGPLLLVFSCIIGV